MQRDATLSPDGSMLSVHVPMTFRRRGGRKVVISPNGVPAQVDAPLRSRLRSCVDETLVQSIAQAFHFQRLLDDGHFATVSELARDRKLDPSFVSRTLRLTLLAPDLIGSILDGRQSVAIDRQKLLHELPMEWHRQLAR